LHEAGRLAFFGSLAHLTEQRAFLRHLAPVRKKRWVVYAKAPFAGPEAVLAYLSRYTHRVAISNSRLIAFDETGVTFRLWPPQDGSMWRVPRTFFMICRSAELPGRAAEWPRKPPQRAQPQSESGFKSPPSCFRSSHNSSIVA